MANKGWALAVVVLMHFSSAVQAAELSSAREQQIVRDVLSIYQPQAGLAAGEELEFQKCGTSIMVEARWLWPRLSEDTRARLSQYLEERPVLALHYDTPDGHFRIHYDTTGADAVDLSRGRRTDGLPVYVDSCASILNTVWRKVIDDFGYPIPPRDDYYPQGETAAYDVYLRNLGSYYLGLTQPEDVIQQPIPLATSFLIMDNDYLGYQGYQPDEWNEMMSVTAAHEFFHAVQFGIDLSEYYESASDEVADIWWHEMTSTWMEDAVFDYVNDYLAYLPAFFEHPNWALTTQGSSGHKGLYPYAAVVWPKFLSEHFDEQIVHDIWMQCGEKPWLNSIEAFIAQLDARSASFPTELGRFRLWCYFSGSRWRPFSFSEGAHYPTIPDSAFVTRHSSYPVLDSISPLKRPEYLGTTYIEFQMPDVDPTADFKVKIAPDTSNHLPHFDLWSIAAAGLPRLGDPVLFSTRRIEDPLVIPDWQNYRTIMVMAMPFNEQYSLYKSISGQKFLYQVSDTLKPSDTEQVVHIGPNPYAAGEGHLYVRIVRPEKDETEVFFYTAAGELVRGGREKDASGFTPFYEPKGEGLSYLDIEWDGRNTGGTAVASGVYLCLVRVGDRTWLEKVAVFQK